MNSESDELISFNMTGVYEINPLFGIINVMILESCRDEVDLVNSSCRKALREKQPVVYLPLNKRFGFSDEVILEQNMQIKLGSSQSEFTRLDRILTLLKDVLEYGISDLLQNRSYQMLFQAVENIREMKEDEFKLFSTYNSNYNLNSKLTDEALTDKLEALNQIREVENKIHHIRGHFEEFYQVSGVKYHTLMNWEKSRYEQNLHQQRIKEEIQEKSIEKKRKLIKNEETASNEMLKFYVEHMEDLKADIAKWMAKYDEDMDATDIAIMKERIKVEEMQTQLRDLELKIRTRDKEMLNWICSRNQRREEAIKDAIRNWAAIKIQRWWRNILQERILLRLLMEAPKKKIKKKR